MENSPLGDETPAGPPGLFTSFSVESTDMEQEMVNVVKIKMQLYYSCSN